MPVTIAVPSLSAVFAGSDGSSVKRTTRLSFGLRFDTHT